MAPAFFRSLRPGSPPDDPAGSAPENEEPAGAAPDTAPGTELGADPPPARRALAEALRAVIDPEVGLNIVDLGLVYDVRVEGGAALVRLTMTTPACPMSSYIRQHVEAVLACAHGIERGDVELVWDPPWSPHMIAPEARAGLYGGRPY